jgi:hypothetical protein
MEEPGAEPSQLIEGACVDLRSRGGVWAVQRAARELRLAQLLHDPLGHWMAGRIEVQDVTAVVVNNSVGAASPAPSPASRPPADWPTSAMT